MKKLQLIPLGVNTELLNVKNFGATGDGVTDDTLAVQAILDFLPNGGHIHFPLGTYLLGNLTYTELKPLKITGECSGNHITLPQGTVFKNVSSGAILTLGDGVLTNHTGHTIENILFDGGDVVGAIGIHIKQTNFNQFSRLVFMGFNDDTSLPVHFDGASGWSITNTLFKCKIYKCHKGIKLTKTTATNIYGGYYLGKTDDTTSIGIETDDNGDTLELVDVHFDSWAIAIDNNIPNSSFVCVRFEANIKGIICGLTGHRAKIIGCNHELGGVGTGVQIDSGCLNTQLIGNSYTNIVAGTRVDDNGTDTTNTDELGINYDLVTKKISWHTGVSLSSPTDIENLSSHATLTLTSNLKKYSLRSRSDGWFDFKNETDGKVLFTCNPSGFIQPSSYTVATLPTGAASGLIYVSDETGGATMAFHNGTNWLRVRDNVIVS